MYLKNDGNEPKSAAVRSSTLYVWHSDNRFPGIYSDTTAEVDPSQCEVLEPEQQMIVNRFDFSREKWPLGGLGMSEALGTKEPPPGIYLVYFSATTADCVSADGDKLEGANFSNVMAVEVEE
jgi:hypothetical protein